MNLTRKRIGSKWYLVNDDNTIGLYQFGRWWVAKDLLTKRILGKATERYQLEEQLGKAEQ